MKISISTRILKVYITLGKTFGMWFSPLITGILISILRLFVGFFRIVDKLIPIVKTIIFRNIDLEELFIRRILL